MFFQHLRSDSIYYSFIDKSLIYLIFLSTIGLFSFHLIFPDLYVYELLKIKEFFYFRNSILLVIWVNFIINFQLKFFMRKLPLLLVSSIMIYNPKLFGYMLMSPL